MADSYLADDTGPFAMVPLWMLDRFSPMEIRVYGFLASHANNVSGELIAGNRKLGAEMGLHPDTVRKAKNALMKAGAIQTTPRHRSDGSRSSDQTRLTTSAPKGWVNPILRESVKSDPQTDDLAGRSSAPIGSTDPYLPGPQTRAELDEVELDEENKRNLSEFSSSRRQSVKRTTSVGLPSELRESCRAFIDAYREWSPDLRDELPEEIERVYAEVVSKREIAPEQIMAKLRLYFDGKVRREQRSDDWFEEDVRKPTNFLRHEVQPGIDYASVSRLGRAA